jgi:stage V sporulation protein B
MLPTALAQLIEAIGKLLFGLFFVALAAGLSLSKEKTAAYAILGLSVASCLTYLVLLMLSKKLEKPIGLDQKATHAILFDTLKSALPITASSLAATLASSLDLLFLMRALQSVGYSPDAANAAWGNYSALVLPLFHMPQVLLVPIASATLPALRGFVAKGEGDMAEKTVKSAMSVTVSLSLLAALGLSLFSRDILSLVFTDEAAVARAYPQLSLVAMAIFPFGLMSLSATFLQAYGKLWLPTVSLLLGAILKIAVTVFGVSLLGEAVSAFGTLLSYTLSAAINIASLSRLTKQSVMKKLITKPFVLALLSVGGALAVRILLSHASLSPKPATLFSIGIAAILAGFFSWLLGAITKEDLCALGMTKSIE